MSLNQSERDAIIAEAFNQTKEEFAKELATRTTLTFDKVLTPVRDDKEREALVAVISEVTKEATGNNEKAKAINNIAGGVETLVKIVGLLF